MTPRHLQAAALHEAHKKARQRQPAPPLPQANQDRTMRPGMAGWHVAVGQVVHRCAGDLAEHRAENRAETAGRIIEWVSANVTNPKVFGNLSRARAQICTMAGVYLHSYAPGTDAQYLGAELAFDGGRIDLAWHIPDLGVVIDELKTTAWVRLSVDNTMLEQAQRYRDVGSNEWGEDFAGVRFLPLLNPREARFIDAEGLVSRLSSSPAHVIGERRS